MKITKHAINRFRERFNIEGVVSHMKCLIVDVTPIWTSKDVCKIITECGTFIGKRDKNKIIIVTFY